MRKIIFLKWGSFMDVAIERTLKKMGIKYQTYEYSFSDWDKDDIFCETFLDFMKTSDSEIVFSVNFSPLISVVCQELERKYISWIYDSPIHIRNLETMKNDCNQIFLFDRGLVESYQKMGISTTHLPLAVDTELFLEVAKKRNGQYTSEVSMVGQLYQTQYQYFMSPLSEYEKGFFEGIINAQMKLNEANMIPEWITDDILEKMNEVYAEVSVDKFQMGRRELEFLLAQEVTARERYLVLSLLSSQYQVKLYSNDKDERLKNVEFAGYVDYHTQMPAIFANSSINLNISLRTIQSGIPLRVLDILGCGGFAISNYQSEIEEYFHIGQEIEIYTSLEELLEKTEFYLRHDTLRRKISQAGLVRVQKDFSFEDRIRQMLHDK